MSTRKHIMLNLFVSLLLTACSSDIFVSHCGNMPTEERISQLQKGQTKDEVLDILGTPSSVVSLDQNTWIYMSSDIKKVLGINVNSFYTNQVDEIERLNKEQGRDIAVNENETKTYGNRPGFFERYFGGVGQFMPFGHGSSNQVNQ